MQPARNIQRKILWVVTLFYCQFTLAQPCLTKNGKPRLYDCEFVVDKIQLVGSPFSIQYPLKIGRPTLNLSVAKAVSNKPTDFNGLKNARRLTYNLQLTVRRKNNPAKSAPDGYYFLNYTPAGLEEPFLSDVAGIGVNQISFTSFLSKQALSIKIGDTKTVLVPFQVTVIPSDSGGYLFPVLPVGAKKALHRGFYIINEATTLDLQTNKSGYGALRDFAEWWTRIYLFIEP